MSKIIDSANKAIDDVKVHPILLMVNQANAGWLYLIFRGLWFLPEILFGKDACTMARNKLAEKLNSK